MGGREAPRSRRSVLPLSSSSSSLAAAQGCGQAKPAIAGGGGDSGPLARVGLARAGAPGPERGGGPDATAGGGGASATSLPAANGLAIWCVAVTRDGDVVAGSVRGGAAGSMPKRGP